MKKYVLTLLLFCAIITPLFAMCVCEDQTIGYSKEELQAEKASLEATLIKIRAMNLEAEAQITSKIIAVDTQVQSILIKEAEELNKETPIKVVK